MASDVVHLVKALCHAKILLAVKDAKKLYPDYKSRLIDFKTVMADPRIDQNVKEKELAKDPDYIHLNNTVNSEEFKELLSSKGRLY